jgi:hypothetical protein
MIPTPTKETATAEPGQGLYRIFIPAYDALEGFFDLYGNPVIEDPEQEVEGIDGDFIDIGSKTYLKNERRSFKDNPSELNEVTRQFPFTEDEAFRDSIEGSLFNIGKIYQQIEYNEELFPEPCSGGQLYMEGERQRGCFLPPLTEGLGFAGCQTQSKEM